MVIKKRQVLWDWTNSAGPGNAGVPQAINAVPFGASSPVASFVNWNVWVPPELKDRAPFRPMVRSMGETKGNDWAIVEKTPYPIILFFNEPERAAISPEQARDIWYRQMLPLRKDKHKKLASPAVANDANGQNWLAKFMQLVAKDPPDYLCLHYYSTSGDAAIKYIEGMHKKYPKLKIMVTEIASIDRNYQSVLAFSVQLCNWMDKQEYILEYGLFDFQRKVADAFVSPAGQLMDASGRFTQLGHMYLHDQPMKLPATGQHTNFLLADVGPLEPVVKQHHDDSNTDQSRLGEPLLHQGPEHDQAAGEGKKEEQECAAEELDRVREQVANGAGAGAEHLFIMAAVAGGLSADQQKALEIQNNGRKGKGLKPLTWDNELAANAAGWARQMAQKSKMEHSTGGQRPNQGENLAYAWASNGISNPLAGAAKMWMDEARNYHGEPIGQGNFAAYGHYTQCMWKSTTKVGIASAKDAKGAVFTCARYSPPGNWTGQKPY